MTAHMRVWPAAQVEALVQEIAKYPGCQLATVEVEGKKVLRILPAKVEGAVVKAAGALDGPLDFNDSFICPGNPLCPK